MVVGAQLSGHTPGEMQEELSPEGTQAPNLCRTLERCRVKWPKANNQEWLQFDADTILEVTASTRHALHPPQEPQEVLSEECGEKRQGQEVGWISTKSFQVHKVTAWKEVEWSTEIDHHLRDTCYDRSREQDLGHCQHPTNQVQRLVQSFSLRGTGLGRV